MHKVFIYVVTMKSTINCNSMLFIVLSCPLWFCAFISHQCCSSTVVPRSYSITKSDRFRNILPDNFGGCETEKQKTNCSFPGKLFDGVKPEENNASLFHLWQGKSDNDIQLMLNFAESVIIRKVVWTFYYNSNGSPAIPAANITQWNLTAYNRINETVTGKNITRQTMGSHLLVYTMVVQGSVAAQRWGGTFSAPNTQWLLLSEVEICGSNAGVCLNTTLVSQPHLYRPFA